MTERVMRYEARGMWASNEPIAHAASPGARGDGSTTSRESLADEPRAHATSERADNDDKDGTAGAYDAMCSRMKDRWKGDASKGARAESPAPDQPSDDDKSSGQGRRDLAPHERRMTDRWKK
ncbi:MAG TPA: hypothetical protein VK841_22465 [Polyangiaceae bacterium]|jgi:hypothetical protein|nr:hypothetical protein [Polyangiaceae bacterium]